MYYKIHIFLQVRGDLSTFQWIENNRWTECQKNLVRVIYTSLNFKDVMLASGKLTHNFDMISKGRLAQDIPLGLEYVGYDVNGHRIMGLSYK